MINPGATIGILGGGQLGRMTAMAAARLGYRCHIYAQSADEPACQVTPYVTLGTFEDEKQLAAFANQVDVITLEWENVPVAALEFLAARKPVHPGAGVLKITQDRVLEKTTARDLGLGVPEFRALKTKEDAVKAVAELGVPCVFKTARFGYDGKGQAVVRDAKDAASAFESLKTDHAIAEAFVKFDCEVSVIVARSSTGAMKSYPTVENRHVNGILDETHVPAAIAPALDEKARITAEILADKLGVVGLLAVEMFVVGDTILMNEMAPRPHNSGHWSMDFAATSQFEQLVRAICGLPLGDTAAAPCMMKNLIGDAVNDWQRFVAEPAARLHLYGKGAPRPGRKMGHVNIKK